MNKKEKLAYQKNVEDYLQKNRVYDVFERMINDLVITQPEHPIQFLINLLQKPKHKKIFIVGPRGSKAVEQAQQIGQLEKLTTISVGQLLKNQVTKRTPIGQQIQRYINRFSYVKDQIVCSIVLDNIKKLITDNTNFILQGFPKTRIQGLALQRAGIIPDAFMILNQSDSVIRQTCNTFLSQQQKFLQKKDSHGEMIEKYLLQYQHNIGQIKQIYSKYFFQIDCSKPNPIQDILVNTSYQRLLRFKINQKAPKKPINLILITPPGQTYSYIGKTISQKYGFIYVSLTQLISNQISKKTDVGKLALNLIIKGQQCKFLQLVPINLVKGIIQNRINKVDCHLNGYILDGFPQSKDHIDLIQQLMINPNFIILLQQSSQQVKQKLRTGRVDPETGIVYDGQNKSLDANIRNRVVKLPQFSQQILSHRVSRWYELFQCMQQRFQQKIFKVQQIQSRQNVLESIYHKIEHGLQ